METVCCRIEAGNAPDWGIYVKIRNSLGVLLLLLRNSGFGLDLLTGFACPFSG
jgi:hypothetical protein